MKNKAASADEPRPRTPTSWRSGTRCARGWPRTCRPTAALDGHRAGFAAHRAWERQLADARLSVVSWPREYGGRDASLLHWLIFEEEYHGAGAPGRVGQNGLFLLAPTLFAHGTDEQRDRLLPPMARGDEVWAQAWSEPEAGSDLAALRSHRRTRATAAGCCPARRPGARGRRSPTGRSACSAPTRGRTPPRPDLPDVRPARRRRHRAADQPARRRPRLRGDLPGRRVRARTRDVLGAVGDGWRVAMSTAGNERGLSLRSPGRFWPPPTAWSSCTASTPGPGRLRDRVVDAWIGAQAYRLHTFGAVTRPPRRRMGAASTDQGVLVRAGRGAARDRAGPARPRPSWTRPGWTGTCSRCRADLRRHQRDPAQRHRRAGARPAP